MAIVFDKENRLFTLCTKNSMYQMKADDKGILLHTYYGRKTDICDYSYLIQRRDHGFSGNPDEAAGDRTYSTDTLPQEYSSLEAETIVRVHSISAMTMEQELWDFAMKAMRSSRENIPFRDFRQCMQTKTRQRLS